MAGGMTPAPSGQVDGAPSREVRRSHDIGPFRRAFSHVLGNGIDESPSMAHQEGRETAGRMLSPILARAREEYQLERASMTVLDPAGRESYAVPQNGKCDSPKVPGVPSVFKDPSLTDLPRNSKLGRRRSLFASQAVNYDARPAPPIIMPTHKGGEGIRRLVETRERNRKLLGLSVEYWDISLFSFNGRAWPVLPQLIYTVYSTIIIAICCEFIKNLEQLTELDGLRYLISTVGLALFLLLSFRTNSSYERWWEGRKLWDGISSKVDDLVRLSLAWVAAKDRECASGLIRWSLAYAYVAKKILRTEERYPELAGILSREEIEDLENDIDPLTMVSDKISFFVHQTSVGPSDVNPAIFGSMDANIKGLNCDMTGCLRILGTPMPFAYIIHLRSFIVLWLLGLPFAFVYQLRYWSILICWVVGYELLGFETISVEVENPFGTDFNDLPLDTITSELFVKAASALAKMGHMVDIIPIVKADPLFSECRHAPIQTSRRGSEPLEEVVHPVVVPNREPPPGIFTAGNVGNVDHGDAYA